MHLLKQWLLMVFFVFYFFQIYAQIHSDNIDKKDYFCGPKLSKTLDQLCAMYNSPIAFERKRLRRQVVDECCKAPCTPRHLLLYYCFKVNSSIASALKLPSLDPGDSRDYQSDDVAVTESNPRETSDVGSRKTKSGLVRVKNALKPTHQQEPSSFNNNKVADRKRHCKCRKRRAKRLKKLQRIQQLKSRNSYFQNVPPPKIGQIEDAQDPFYVWKYSRVV